VREPPPQLILTRDGFIGDQLENLPLPESFVRGHALPCQSLYMALNNYAR
jgi:hypothetical protein